MKRRKNRKTERAGVNATRSIFEEADHVFQEVDTANDYGRDAFVDFARGDRISEICIALQIKSGPKYKRATGYAIPIEGHAELWLKSTVAMAGIVYDSDLRKLFWCDITGFLLAHSGSLPSTIPVSVDNELTLESLKYKFEPHFRILALEGRAQKAVLLVCSEDSETRRVAMLDCLIFGRSDAKVFIVLRYLIPMLKGRTLRIALSVLAHTARVAEVVWTDENWVPDDVCSELKPHLRWTIMELYKMLASVSWKRWQRGDTGQDLYMLVTCDPAFRRKIERVALIAIQRRNEAAAWAALYLTVYWAGDDGVSKYEELLARAPEFRRLKLAGELEYCLGESGCLSLF